MKIRRSSRRQDEKIELQMTPMIDIVFQLLVFFILTFKIVIPEGDFNIRMPANAPQQRPPDEPDLPPTRVLLKADANGNLVSITIGNLPVGTDMRRLRQHAVEALASASGPQKNKVEYELDCDYQLKYEHTMLAVTMISGRRQGDQMIPLIQNIKFSSPKPPPI
jgi:biopolymer transport protein ExbD